MTMWFIETGRNPFEDLVTLPQLKNAVVYNDTRPSLEKCVLYPQLIEHCWCASPKSRIKDSDLTIALNAVLTSLANPPTGPLPIPGAKEPSSDAGH